MPEYKQKRNDKKARPSAIAIVARTMISAIIIWTFLITVISYFVPIDSTGSAEGDAISDKKVPWVLASAAVGTVGLTTVDVRSWYRKKKTIAT